MRCIRKSHLIIFVKNDKRTLEFRLWGIFEIENVFAYNFAISNEKALYLLAGGLKLHYLSIHHVRNHHDTIKRRIRKLEWQLCCLDIKSQNDGIRTRYLVRAGIDCDFTLKGFYRVPETHSEILKRD